MKHVLIFTLLFASFCIQAQEIKEQKVSMSLGPQNAFYVEIEGADKKMAEKAFYEVIKEYGKMKENKKAREHFLMATKIPLINGTSPLDIYAKFEEGKGIATTYVWVDLGGAFVNSKEYESQSVALRRFVSDYYIAARKSAVSEELKIEEKSLSNLEKDLKKLRDKNDDYYRDIEKAKQKIADAEKDIEKNVIEQASKNKEIETQKAVIEKVVDKFNNLGKKG